LGSKTAFFQATRKFLNTNKEVTVKQEDFPVHREEFNVIEKSWKQGKYHIPFE
jgi:hypothetical protein